MRQILVGILRLPIMPPVFQRLAQALFFFDVLLRVQPIKLAGDDDWRLARIQDGGERAQILIGNDNTAIAGARRTTVSAVRRTVQPDAVTILALMLIPFVGVIQRIGAVAEEIRQFLRQLADGEIITLRCPLVAFGGFPAAVLAQRYVKIGDKMWFSILITVEIQARFAGIYHNDMMLFGIKLP